MTDAELWPASLWQAALRGFRPGPVLVMSHDDADGWSSAAVLRRHSACQVHSLAALGGALPVAARDRFVRGRGFGPEAEAARLPAEKEKAA